MFQSVVVHDSVPEWNYFSSNHSRPKFEVARDDIVNVQLWRQPFIEIPIVTSLFIKRRNALSYQLTEHQESFSPPKYKTFCRQRVLKLSSHRTILRRQTDTPRNSSWKVPNSLLWRHLFIPLPTFPSEKSLCDSGWESHQTLLWSSSVFRQNPFGTLVEGATKLYSDVIHCLNKNLLQPYTWDSQLERHQTLWHHSLFNQEPFATLVGGTELPIPTPVAPSRRRPPLESKLKDTELSIVTSFARLIKGATKLHCDVIRSVNRKNPSATLVGGTKLSFATPVAPLRKRPPLEPKLEASKLAFVMSFAF